MLSFSKLEALGNDFVLIDARAAPFDPSPEQVQRLGNRRLGLGFDQLLILRQSASALVRVDIHNQDGSRAEQCGNGMRAIALFLDQQSSLAAEATLETAAGLVAISLASAQQIKVDLPPPDFTPPPGSPPAMSQPWVEKHAGLDMKLDYVDLGNPHLVIDLPDPGSPELVQSVGSTLTHHPLLPAGANVSFAHVVDHEHVLLSVFERGAGPTLACGSGACATAVSLIRQKRVASTVSVEQPGGRLVINWRGLGEPITMIGPARRVFDGQFDPETF